MRASKKKSLRSLALARNLVGRLTAKLGQAPSPSEFAKARAKKAIHAGPDATSSTPVEKNVLL